MFVVLFVSHFKPIPLYQVAKKLKKMQVNVDIVNFGETSTNTSKVILHALPSILLQTSHDCWFARFLSWSASSKL
jgi:hypothetical protein